MNKDIVPEGFTLGLALYDAVPVICFGISVILLGAALDSRLFLLGGALSAWAGLAKVLWKIIVVTKKKNIWWMFLQMRICMPIGFLLMIIGGIAGRNNPQAAAVWRQAVTMPASICFLVGLAGFVLMGVAGATMNSADPKTNWIEQSINTIGQLGILAGVILLMTQA